MTEFTRITNRTRTIAAIAIFSALYAVIRPIPLGPMIGVSAQFSVSDCLAPVYGIILGPFTGGLSIIIGTFLGMVMGKAPVFFGLDFLPAFINAVAIGFLVRRKWWPVIVLNVGLLAAFLVNPYTLLFVNVPFGSSTLAIPFFWLHIVALIVLISPLGRKAGQWVDSRKTAFLTAAVAILAFVGTMMQHLTGSIINELIYGPITNIYSIEKFMTNWNVIFYMYPIERTILVILSIVIGVPLVRVLKKYLSPPKLAVTSEQSSVPKNT